MLTGTQSPGSHTPTPTEKLVRDDEYVPYSAQGCQPARFVFRYRDERERSIPYYSPEDWLTTP